MISKANIGVVHGRFQIFHLKHMEYILAAKMRCNKIIIGIDEPEGFWRKKNNPFTYYERYEMIRDALIDFGLRWDEFEIVPFPIEYPARLLNYVPKDAVYYLNICDNEDEKILQILEKLDVQTEVLFRKTPETKGITGTEIREHIVLGEEWRNYVPRTVYEYIRSRYLDERLMESEDSAEDAEERHITEKRADEGKTQDVEYLDGDEDIKIIKVGV